MGSRTEGALNEYLFDWLVGTVTTARVVTNLQPGADETLGLQHVGIKHRTSTAGPVVFAGGAGPTYLLDGAVTKRVGLAIGRYDYNDLFFYFTSAVGAPSVSVRYYISGDSTLTASDATLHTQWQEVMFPEYRSEASSAHSPFSANITDGTDPSANLVAAVAGVIYRVYGYSLMAAGTAVNAGLEDTAGTDLTPLWPFAANGGGVWPVVKGSHYVQTSAGLGIRIDKSAAQTVSGNIVYRSHPLVVTAAQEGVVRIPRAEGLAIEVIGTGSAGVDQLTMQWQHVGYA